MSCDSGPFDLVRRQRQTRQFRPSPGTKDLRGALAGDRIAVQINIDKVAEMPGIGKRSGCMVPQFVAGQIEHG